MTFLVCTLVFGYLIPRKIVMHDIEEYENLPSFLVDMVLSVFVL